MVNGFLLIKVFPMLGREGRARRQEVGNRMLLKRE